MWAGGAERPGFILLRFRSAPAPPQTPCKMAILREGKNASEDGKSPSRNRASRRLLPRMLLIVFLQTPRRVGFPKLTLEPRVDDILDRQDAEEQIAVAFLPVLRREKSLLGFDQTLALEDKGLIETEPTTVTNHEGKNWNGNLKYTILPISEIVEAKFQQELRKADTARRLQEYDRKHPRKEAT